MSTFEDNLRVLFPRLADIQDSSTLQNLAAIFNRAGIESTAMVTDAVACNATATVFLNDVYDSNIDTMVANYQVRSFLGELWKAKLPSAAAGAAAGAGGGGGLGQQNVASGTQVRIEIDAKTFLDGTKGDDNWNKKG